MSEQFIKNHVIGVIFTTTWITAIYDLIKEHEKVDLIASTSCTLIKNFTKSKSTKTDNKEYSRERLPFQYIDCKQILHVNEQIDFIQNITTLNLSHSTLLEDLKYFDGRPGFFITYVFVPVTFY